MFKTYFSSHFFQLQPLSKLFLCLTILICVFFYNSHESLAQLGGQNSFQSLNIPQSARQSSIGSENVSSGGKDAFSFSYNPAIIQKEAEGTIGLSYVWYYADIGHTSIAYVDKYKKGMWGVSAQFLSYGEMERYDPSGNFMGTFSALDNSIQLSYQRQSGPFALGGNLKWAHSQIDAFSAGGFFLDIGGAFIHPEKELTVGLVFKNIGYIYNNHSLLDDSWEMPFDAQLGVSFKPENMPLRFSVTYHHLFDFDIAFDDPSDDDDEDDFGNNIGQKSSFADKLSRHWVFGGEFVIGKVLELRVGYNILKRKELKLQSYGGLAGFSFGGALQIKQFNVSFGQAWYHPAGGTSTLTLECNLSDLLKKDQESKRQKVTID